MSFQHILSISPLGTSLVKEITEAWSSDPLHVEVYHCSDGEQSRTISDNLSCVKGISDHGFDEGADEPSLPI